MKFTFSWLKEHLETTASVDEISEKLTSLGLEVDTITNPAKELNAFKIAHIIKAEPHPDADKLKLCHVFTGKETLQIVCGAPNARPDMKVVLAPIGSLIPSNGMKIKAAKVRGIESNGMLCSAAELGLEGDAHGILDLDVDAPIGETYAIYAGLNDPIFDLEITPNRGDCLGVRGVARDLSAAGLGRLLQLSVPNFTNTGDCPVNIKLDIDDEHKQACPYFTARLVRGVKNGPSPDWLKQKLRAIGLRSISTLVDITNYMTFTHNRPMHVFDFEKIKGETLTIRMAKTDEKFLGLDEKEYSLSDHMTVITDESGVVSLAGIMGGESTGCSDDTVDVLLESAFFDPITTAMTGRRSGINSDSRFRFERGVDPSIVLEGLDMATQLILDLCGGEASEPVIAGAEPDFSKTHGASLYFDPKTVKTRGGVTASREKIESILTALGFGVKAAGCDYQISVPSWRFDMDCSESLVEEVCRIIGYDHIEEEDLPPAKIDEFFESNKGSLQNQKRRHIIRRLLASRGLCECNTWSFLEESKAKKFGGGDPSLKLTNPLSKEFEVMRPSLLVNLITGAGKNKDRGLENSALFEVGAVYDASFEDLQETRIGGIRSDDFATRHWLNKERSVDLFDAKADLFAAIEVCGVSKENLQVKQEAPSYFHPGRSGTVYLGPKTILGVFGELHPQILKDMNVDSTVVGFELFLDRFPMAKEKNKKKLLKTSTLQPIHRDFSFLMDEVTPVQSLIDATKKVNRNLITNVQIFDVYVGKGIPEGKKSVALTVTFEPFEKTLTDTKINAIMDEIIIAIGSKTGAELRA